MWHFKSKYIIIIINNHYYEFKLVLNIPHVESFPLFCSALATNFGSQ
jgi:hypothetical protein